MRLPSALSAWEAGWLSCAAPDAGAGAESGCGPVGPSRLLPAPLLPAAFGAA